MPPSRWPNALRHEDTFAQLRFDRKSLNMSARISATARTSLAGGLHHARDMSLLATARFEISRSTIVLFGARIRDNASSSRIATVCSKKIRASMD